jgi:hypothetical protein
VTPKHPVGPAFDQAAERATAWRKAQEAALDQEQKKEYERMQRLQNAQLRAHEDKFQEELNERIDEEKRKLLLHKPEPALRMLPGRPLKERRAEYLATQNVTARHEAERTGLEQKFEQERDGYLHAAEASRQRDAREDLSAALQARAVHKDRGQERDRGRERER